MKISDVKNLWQSDGYTLHLLFLHRAESSIWYLYVTEFCYEMYEYRRHFGIITEVDAKSGDVIRSRVLEYDKSSYSPAEEMKHQVFNIINTKWGILK